MDALDGVGREQAAEPLVGADGRQVELDRLEAQYTPEERRAERQEELSFIRPHIEQWQAEGRVRDADPDALAGAVRAVVFLTLHREDIGENYETVRDLLVEVVADGVVTE